MIGAEIGLVTNDVLTPPPDALLVVSFGGPEGPADVRPFLEKVTRGRNVPPGRLDEVERQYALFGGVSPLGDECRRLCGALEALLLREGPRLPVYLGQRHSAPHLEDTLRRMARDGVRHALAFVTSAYSSYPGCRQYLDDIEQARTAIGPDAPVVEKLRPFWNHPGFIEPVADALATAVRASHSPGARTRILFSAHSLPLAMARVCDYELQLRAAAALVHQRIPDAPPWELVFQSRSGPAQEPWLEPDIAERMAGLAGEGVEHVLAAPLGFVLDHMEVGFDLDVRAAARAREAGIGFARTATPARDPRFVAMVRELVRERFDPELPLQALGALGARPTPCTPGCCPPR